MVGSYLELKSLQPNQENGEDWTSFSTGTDLMFDLTVYCLYVSALVDDILLTDDENRYLYAYKLMNAANYLLLVIDCYNNDIEQVVNEINERWAF